jgi:hypothetical protein
MPTSSCLKRAVLRGKTTCLDLRCYGRKRRKPAWRGLPKVSPRRAYQGLFLVFGGEGGHQDPDGHFKFPRLWSPKFPQAGRFNYGVLAASRVSLAAASLSR